MKTFRTLSIGNSFSEDALEYCHVMAEADGIQWETVNMEIGGCSLEQHWKYLSENQPNYGLEINGEVIRQGELLRDHLTNGEYDVVTLQQASHFSGMPETYFPYVVDLCKVIRECQPDAKLYMQETWAYEWTSDHWAFPNYHKDQREMYERIRISYAAAAISVNAEIIPTGDLVQYFREQVPGFDSRNGGMSLNRDGFHLNMPYGRYLNSALWYSVLLGADIRKNTFVPKDATNLELLQTLKDGVYAFLHP